MDALETAITLCITQRQAKVRLDNGRKATIGKGKDVQSLDVATGAHTHAALNALARFANEVGMRVVQRILFSRTHDAVSYTHLTLPTKRIV